MKVGVIIPTRGDRSCFASHCLRQFIKCQRHSFEQGIQLIAYLVDFEPTDDAIDITKRYANGYEFFKNCDIDLIAFMEDDDWYAEDYFSFMIKKWIDAGKPDLFGTNYTIYYHLKLQKYYKRCHETMSYAMSTFIKPDLEFQWGLPHDPYTDVWLWNNPSLSNRKVVQPEKLICIGMKHGLGKTGGQDHIDGLERYTNDDAGMQWLAGIVEPDSLDFYKIMSAKLNK